jgi:hypothetical protein
MYALPTMNAFERATSIVRLDDARFTLDVPAGWEQGRGAFGGVALGALLRAIEATEPDRERIARTLTGELAGPVVAGPAEIRVTPMRRGKNQSNLRADLLQDGVILATASAVLSTPRTPTHAVDRPRTPPAFDVTPPTTFGDANPARFAKHFEYRVTGPMPFVGGSDPVASGWLRLREPLTAFDAPALVAHLDAYWSAIMSVEPTPRPFATITFVAELLVDPRTLAVDAPFFHDARVLASANGFVIEERALYQHGKLVAMNHQTFAMLA